MNSYKILIVALIALLVMPAGVSAVWANGKYYTDEEYANLTAGDKVVYDQATGTMSKYNANVGSKYDIANDPNTYSGRAEVRIRSSSNLLNPTMTLANILNLNATKEISVNSDGINQLEGLAPGEYELTLNNFNLPKETKRFTIAAGQMGPTYVEFIGQAFTGASACKPFYTIEKATYGAIETRERTVTDIEAWDEVIPATPDVYTIVNYGPYTGRADKVPSWSWHYDFMIGNQKYEIDNHHGDYKYLKVGGQPAQTIHHTATTHIETYLYGVMSDVTQNVQNAVGLGATSFVFSNGWVGNYEGGIFNNPTDRSLLVSINDPAKDVKKNVYIKYNNGCGMTREIGAMEYDYINLVTGSVE